MQTIPTPDDILREHAHGPVDPAVVVEELTRRIVAELRAYTDAGKPGFSLGLPISAAERDEPVLAVVQRLRDRAADRDTTDENHPEAIPTPEGPT